jgi:hypothetical protein
MDEWLTLIMERVDARWGEGAHEGPYCKQEIVDGFQGIVDELKGAAARVVARANLDYCNVCENFPCMGGHPPAG